MKPLVVSSLLAIRDLKVYYFTPEGIMRAVDGVSFEMDRMEIVGLVGESGCGKSTLAHSIIQLLPESGRIVGGEVLFEGKDLLKSSDEEMRRIRGSKIAMVFQNPTSSLNPVYTIGNQIYEAVEAHQWLNRKSAMEKVVNMLEVVGIPEARRRVGDYPHQFSGGMQQRSMIAMALSCNPSLLIADEPTSSLDVTIQAQILDLLRELKKGFGSSILLITHDIGIVAELSDRVAVMYAGEIVEYADAEKLFEYPMHPYTQGLIRAIPRSDMDVDRLGIIQGLVPDLLNPPSGCKFHPRCPYAMDICRKQKPRPFMVERGHQVACFLYDKNA